MQQDCKHIPIYLHNQVMACLRKYLTQAYQLLNTEYKEPKIVYKPKGSIAGSAILNRWEIQLNTIMLFENGEKFIEEVVPHELSHLITFQIYGKVKPHGKEWQYIMSEIMKQPPKVTHNFNFKRKEYVYICDCQEHYLSSIRHNKIEKNKISYQCLKCGSILKLKNFV